MSCLNPRLMLVVNTKGLSLVTLKRLEELNWKINYDDCKAYRLVSKESRQYILEQIPDYIDHSCIEVPCGNCVSCRLDYSKDWANRCTLEALDYKCNYFVTLTYDDDHLHKGEYGNATINKKDLDDFIHALRVKFKRSLNHVGLRYFYCQEYGDSSMRPHAHLILFNCPLPDLVDYFPQGDGTIIRQKNDMTGDFYLYSQFIKDIWEHGNILIAPCCWNTNAYVSRYILKKQKGQGSQIYTDLGIVPPYIRMSNKPGIGYNYFFNHKDEFEDNPTIIMARDHKDPLVSVIPRYFKKKLFEEKPSLKEVWKDKSLASIDKDRSLLKGKQLINDNRANQESKINKYNEIFKRDC